MRQALRQDRPRYRRRRSGRSRFSRPLAVCANMAILPAVRQHIARHLQRFVRAQRIEVDDAPARAGRRVAKLDDVEILPFGYEPADISATGKGREDRVIRRAHRPQPGEERLISGQAGKVDAERVRPAHPASRGHRRSRRPPAGSETDRHSEPILRRTRRFPDGPRRMGSLADPRDPKRRPSSPARPVAPDPASRPHTRAAPSASTSAQHGKMILAGKNPGGDAQRRILAQQQRLGHQERGALTIPPGGERPSVPISFSPAPKKMSAFRSVLVAA